MSAFDFNEVELVDCAQDPVNLIEYVAKVSNPDGQKEEWERGRLLKYLVANQHWSPLEMVNVLMYVETTRDIARQLLRHRSFTFQEFSQRYAAVDVANFTFKDARRQDTKNRQNSIDDLDAETKEAWYSIQSRVELAAQFGYAEALELGIAKEVARVILPEGMTPSRLYVNGSVRSWYHYCQLRCGNGTQLEHQDLAVKINNKLASRMPELFQIKEDVK